MRLSVSFAPLTATLAALLLPFPALADALVDNVDGITLDEEGDVVRFTGLLLSKDGMVVKLLKRGEKRPEQLDWRADMKGKVMIPGMVDAHGHIMGLGFRALALDLSSTRSLAQAQDAIRAYAAANPSRRWLTGGGWNQELWGLGRFPTSAELDVATGDVPTWLIRADGHAGWANSAALKAAGITAATKAPAGGRIEMVAGKPGGIFIDSAMALIERAVPQPTQIERNMAFIKAQELLLSMGVTASADMGTSIDDWLTFRRMADRGLLRMRIMSYADGVDVALRVAGTAPTPWIYDDKLRMGGIKLVADGALGSRGAWLKAPYSDAPTQKGIAMMSDAQLMNSLVRGAMDGFQFAIHAIGDRANQQVLDAINEVRTTYTGDRRWRLEHAQVLDQSDLTRLAPMGVIASMQPVHATSDRDMAQVRLGEGRLSGAYAWKSLVDNGTRIAFGSDFPVESPNPFVGWATGFTRTDAAGQPDGGWRVQEAVSRERSWRGFTVDAAYAGFAEGKFGRLAPGLRADFLVIDRDPLSASPEQLRATQVIETWVGGQQVFRRGGSAAVETAPEERKTVRPNEGR